MQEIYIYVYIQKNEILVLNFCWVFYKPGIPVSSAGRDEAHLPQDDGGGEEEEHPRSDVHLDVLPGGGRQLPRAGLLPHH